MITVRVNQNYFRNALLENYDHRCCITNLGIEPLLVSSHIKPWSDADPATERLSPKNGLLLNTLHDRAFDQGLMTIGQNLHIVISSQLAKGEFGSATSGVTRVSKSRRPASFDHDGSSSGITAMSCSEDKTCVNATVKFQSHLLSSVSNTYY